MTRRELSWCSYDFANSAFPTVVSTFVIATYVTTAVAADPVQGQAAWGWMQALAGLVIGLASPLLGAVADAGGRRRGLLLVFTLGMVLATAGLWFIAPDPAFLLPALLLVCLATVSFELGTVFYNAMLPAVARAEAMGRLSGAGFAVGYAGGLICLALSLLVLIRPDPPPFGLDRSAAEHVRAVALLVAVWILLFAWPVLVAVPDPAVRPPIRSAIRQGLAEILGLIRRLPREQVLARFLIARLFYTDGLNTLFAFGAIYAAGRFGMGVEEILLFGILLNVTAGIGAFGGGWVEDRLGSRRTVMLSLACVIAIGSAILLIEDKALFWALGAAIGVFFGPAQAASRTLLARLAPEGERAAWFGLFAMSGRITGFVGPALLAAATTAFASQSAGMAVVVLLLAAGLAVLASVRAR
ncbi:MAG: MFS transporter [Rhodovarius sp.]|nr:MFS transporter [Rhodovarius sp.]MDW8313998.1 MFS transporter [Rhodovarius sp.]